MGKPDFSAQLEKIKNECVQTVRDMNAANMQLNLDHPVDVIDVAPLIKQFGELEGRFNEASQSNYERTIFIMNAFDGFGSHCVNAGFAFKSSKQYEGSAEAIRAASSLFNLLTYIPSAAGGPVGAVIAELLRMSATIIGAFEPQKDSLIQQIGKELNDFQGENIIIKLGGVLHELDLQEAVLKKKSPNGTTWHELLEELTIIKGDAIIWLGEAQGWLARKDLQKTKNWPWVLRGYLLAAENFIQNFSRVMIALKRTGPTGENDVEQANAVLDVILKYYEDFIHLIEPISKNHGTTYRIGEEDKVHERFLTVDDSNWTDLGGVSKRLSICTRDNRDDRLNENRIWTVSRKGLYTGFGDYKKWKLLHVLQNDKLVPIMAGDVAVVKRKDSNSRSDVFTTEGSKVYWRVWDESAAENQKTHDQFLDMEQFYNSHQTNGKVVTFDNRVGELKSISATEDGSVFYIYKNWPDYVFELKIKGKGKYIIDYTTRVEGFFFDDVAADRDYIYSMHASAIYYAPRKSVIYDEDKLTATYKWTMFSEPVSSPQYESIFACADGGLLVTVNKKIYLWDGRTWKKNDKGSALRLSKLPFVGWELFGGIKTAIVELRKLRNAPIGSAIS